MSEETAGKVEYGSGYIYKDKRSEPKEIWKFLFARIPWSSLPASLTVLDIGCASGDLPRFFAARPEVSKVVGLEYDRDLVQLAKQQAVEKCEFVQGDAESFELGEQFDLAVMSGVLTIFENFEPALRCMLRHIKPGGYGYIISIFNEFDIDVRIKFRNNSLSDQWQAGYNLFPLKRIEEFLAGNACSFSAAQHEMPFELAPQADPLRGWTVNLNGKRFIRNGLGLVYNLYLIEFQRSPSACK